MKKFCVFCVAALLFVAACDNFSAPTKDAEDVQYTADGRKMVPISLGTSSSSRALTDTLAKAGVDFYEAVFKDPGDATKFYRKEWTKGQSAKIYLPTGDYGTSTNAILLLGRASDKTLLAVGTVTAVDGATSPNTSVTPTSTSITFTVASLVTDINKTYTAPTPTPNPTSGSTFAITAPTLNATTAGTLPMVDGYPYFAIPHDPLIATTVTATYQLFVSSGSFNTYAPGLKIKASIGGTIGSNSIFPLEGDDLAGILISAQFNTIDKTNIGASDIAFPQVALPLTITVPASTKPGLAKIWIDIPVYGLDNTYVNGITWHIKGGFSNITLDHGKDVNSLGGAILLGIGSIQGLSLTLPTGW